VSTSVSAASLAITEDNSSTTVVEIILVLLILGTSAQKFKSIRSSMVDLHVDDICRTVNERFGRFTGETIFVGPSVNHSGKSTGKILHVRVCWFI
jgi:hypothetical protein